MDNDLGNLKTWRLMLIDDSQLFQNITLQYLAKYPFIEVVGTANSADTGIELAMQKNPQIILLDLEMPGKSGLKSIPVLKAILPECKIIIISLMDRVSYMRVCLETGADAYVEKEQMHIKLIPVIHNIMQT